MYFLKSMTSMNENFIYLCIYTIFLNKKPDFQGSFVHILIIFCVSVENPKEAYPGAEQMFLLYFCLLERIKISQKS